MIIDPAVLRYRVMLDSELRHRLMMGRLDPAQARRDHAAQQFWNVEQMVARLSGMADADVAAYFQRMLDDAEPNTRELVKSFIDRAKAALQTHTRARH
jgi:hypothetical protein